MRNHPIKPLLINTMSTGGAAKACIRLHQGLLNQDVNCQLLTLNKFDNGIKNHVGYPQNRLQKIYNSLDGYKQKILVKLAGVEAFEFIKSPYRIHELETYKQADVINIHWSNRFLDYATFFRNNTKPIIWTLHDMQAFSGGFPYFSEIRSKFLKRTVKKNIINKQKILEDQDIHVVCLSKWLMKESLKSQIFKAFPHYLIPNGIDTSIYKYQDRAIAKKQLGINPNQKTILFVSQAINHKRKGFQYLKEALDHKSMSKVNLIAVGSSQSKTSNSIRSTGYIRDENMLAKLYSACDLFVIPSIEDNLPNTVVESLCCGTPVVGFNIGGIPDMVRHGSNGLISDKITSDGLRNKILDALNSEWRHKNISNNAQLEYALNTQSSQYIQLFTQVLQKSHDIS